MDALPREIAEKLDEVRGLCEKYGVKRLTLFGSAVEGTFDPANSDVDVIVELLPLGDPIREGRAYRAFWYDLERLLDRRVDLLETGAIANPYLAASVKRHQLDLYAAA